MGFRNGDGTEEVPDIEKVELPTNEPENKVRLDDAEDDPDDVPGEREEKVKGRADTDDQPRKKDGTWAEKKAARGKARQEEAAWKTEKADLERRLQQQREEMDRGLRLMREELDQARRQSSRGQDTDPVSAQLADVERQLEQELALIESDGNRGYKNYNALRRQEQKLITMQAIQERDAHQRANAPRPNPYEARRSFIAAEYPWTEDAQRYGDLSRKAWAYRQHLIEVEGRPDTIDTDREALSTIQARFGSQYGLQPPPAAPSQRTRQLYGGPPSRGTPMRNREDIPDEVDLGSMGKGHGLDPKTLAIAVREAFRERNGTR